MAFIIKTVHLGEVKTIGSVDSNEEAESFCKLGSVESPNIAYEIDSSSIDTARRIADSSFKKGSNGWDRVFLSYIDQIRLDHPYMTNNRILKPGASNMAW